MAPWAIKLAAAGNGYSLSEYEKYRFLWDQVVMLEANLHGIPYHEAEVQITPRLIPCKSDSLSRRRLA